MTILWLPAELQLHTLNHLPFRDLLHCRALCRHFRSLIDSSKQLSFKKELGAAGVRDNANYPVQRNKKMDQLWQSNIAWANLHWLCRRRIQLSGTGKLFEVSGGLFFYTIEAKDTDPGNGTTIDWFRLPSRRKPNPGYTPKQVTFDVSLADFAVDAMRDLIFGFELTSFRVNRHYTIVCNLYAKTISTNEIHPSAARHVLSCRFVSPASDFHPNVQVCANHIGVLLTRQLGTTSPDSFDMFLLLDWTTGVTKANMGSYGMEECWETFCFLSTDSVLIPSARNNLLSIYHFNSRPDSLKHALSLLLPEPLRWDGLRHIRLRSQPFSSSSTHATHPTGDIPPFIADPEEAVVVLQLDYRYHSHDVADPGGQSHCLPQVAAIPRRVLSHYAYLAREKDAHLMELIECSHGRDYPVEKAKPAAIGLFSVPCCIHEQLYMHVRKDARSKRFPHLHAEQWIHHARWGIDSVTPAMGCFAYGSRYLGMSSRMELPDAPASSIALYDFNLRNERRGLAHLLEEENLRPYPAPDEEFNEDEDWDYDERTGERRWPVLPPEIVTTPSTVSVSEVFKRQFTTNLPYRVIETEMVLPWDSAILDGERIIGLEFADDATGSIETLDVIVI